MLYNTYISYLAVFAIIFTWALGAHLAFCLTSTWWLFHPQVKRTRCEDDQADLALNGGEATSYPSHFTPTKEPQYLFSKRLSRSQNQSGRSGEVTNLCLSQDSKSR
jgi:hypothetical protein